MELTRSGAERRLAELKRSRVVTGIDIALRPVQRLTVHVARLNDETRREVTEALSETPWLPEIVQAKEKPEGNEGSHRLQAAGGRSKPVTARTRRL